MDLREEAEKLFSQYMAPVNSDFMKYVSGQKPVVLPILSSSFIKKLNNEVTKIFRKEQSMLRIESPVCIVGDLHGHLFDLYRIIKYNGFPNIQKYLFLGDIVDRGDYSLECIIIVYLMKILWPKDVYIIRGNHEFAFLCAQCGFYSQLHSVYTDNALFKSFISSFSYLPLAALVDKTTLCVHAGLSPATHTLEQIAGIERPLDRFDSQPVVDGLVWSDPSSSTEYFESSNRGSGFLFGRRAALDFLGSNGLERLVRGHECVMGGVSELFDKRVVTVFSASNYCGTVGNNCGLLFLAPGGAARADSLPPIVAPPRCRCLFRRVGAARVADVHAPSKEPRTARGRPAAAPLPALRTPRLPANAKAVL